MRKCLVLFFLMLIPFLHLGAQENLMNGLNNLLNDKLFRSSDVSVAVYDLTDDKMLFEHRAQKMVRPASVMKVVTSVTALEYLGADYKIDTDMYILSKDSVNNVYVKGAMDPLFNIEDMLAMASALPAGSVVDTLFADCTFCDSLYWGPGWSWDDGSYSYQPYISPLMLCGGAVEVTVKYTGKNRAPKIVTEPESSYYTIVNEAVCDKPELGKLTVLRDWLVDSNVIRVRGNCKKSVKESVSVYKSADYFMAVLAEKLDSMGVLVKNVSFAATPADGTLLHRTSRPLTCVIEEALLESNNLCAESMAYHLGKMDGTGPTSMAKGCGVVAKFLEEVMGAEDIAVADGSGLSLYNYVTAELLVRILRYGYKKEGMKEVLYDRLPVSGMSGTLKNRMKNSVAYGNIHAKTGTVKAVCTLAGYATAANGHVYAFVLLNTGMQSSRAARQWQDKVCELLCR
jgi:D-alanyl-D-alanine carboxypeptidase/D-alanyl-D-alanine-endopeptidase (penicillin-binding protein 4)